MALGEREIEAAEARTHPYKLADGGGLTLLVRPTGAKWWRFRYRTHNQDLSGHVRTQGINLLFSSANNALLRSPPSQQVAKCV